MEEVQCILDGLFADYKQFHSKFQIDNFIIRKGGGTIYGMYQQAVRETHRRYTVLQRLYLSLGKLNVKKHMMGCDCGGDLEEIKCRQIDLVEIGCDIEAAELAIKNLLVEFKRVVAISVGLKRRLGHLDEKIKEKLEAEMWLHHLYMEAGLSLVAEGRIPVNLLKSIGSLPVNEAMDFLKAIKENPGSLVEYATSPGESLPEDIDQIESELNLESAIKELKQCQLS